jgi:hypothetical protein
MAISRSSFERKRVNGKGRTEKSSQERATEYSFPRTQNSAHGDRELHALKSAALGEINRDQEEALSKVLRQAENLENIVNVILDSAGVETGAVAVRIEELVLSEFLGELKQNFEAICRKSECHSGVGLSRADAGGDV